MVVKRNRHIVAVTGGKGFIGSAVVNELKRSGHKPRIVDRSNGHDILNPQIANLLQGCHAVIHLAGVLGTAELFDRTEEAIDINIKGTAKILMICAKHNVRYIGITMPDVWHNVYQATKQAAFALACAWHKHYGVPTSHVRAFNVFGPGQKVTGVQKIIPTFATRAWKGEALHIWGDGSQTVDLIYVDDVARMLVDALSYGNNEIFDAGTGLPMSVNEVAKTILAITKSKSTIEHLPMRKGEHPTTISASGEGWHLLNWHPIFDYERLRATVEWYKNEV